MPHDAPEFIARLQAVRDAYVDTFRSVSSYLETVDPSVRAECTLRDPSGVILHDTVLNLPCRGDFIYTVDTVPTIETVLSPKPAPVSTLQTGLVDHSILTVRPFAWDALVVTVGGALDIRDIENMRAWYLEWMLPRKLKGQGNIKGVVHALHGPYPAGGNTKFRLDMGTAPVEALEDLFDLLTKRCVGDIDIGKAPHAVQMEAH